jgi:hypothetical protein
MKLSRKIRARMAWAASFLKRRWDFGDYPLDYVDQGERNPNLPERLQHKRWRADLINWPAVSGLGESRAEALADAKEKFFAYQVSGEKMWRPGTGPGIVFADNHSVAEHAALRDHFIQNVLGLEWAWVSDESSLWDFHEKADNSDLYLKIGEVYGVDVSYVEGAKLAAIFAEIMEQIGDFPEDAVVRAVRLSRDARARHNQALPEHPWNPYAPS